MDNYVFKLRVLIYRGGHWTLWEKNLRRQRNCMEIEQKLFFMGVLLLPKGEIMEILFSSAVIGCLIITSGLCGFIVCDLRNRKALQSEITNERATLKEEVAALQKLHTSSVKSIKDLNDKVQSMSLRVSDFNAGVKGGIAGNTRRF